MASATIYSVKVSSQRLGWCLQIFGRVNLSGAPTAHLTVEIFSRLASLANEPENAGTQFRRGTNRDRKFQEV